jgi:hypothetical protein
MLAINKISGRRKFVFNMNTDLNHKKEENQINLGDHGGQ